MSLRMVERRGKLHYFIGDREVSEAEYRKASPSRLKELFESGQTQNGQHKTGWPMNAGDSLGCHPKQVADMQARADKHGINVRYQKNGDVVIPDRGNYAKLLKLERLVNRAEGFHGA